MKKTILVLAIVLMAAQTYALETGLFKVSFMVNRPPLIEGVEPADGGVITEGDTLEISVDASDANEDLLQYQYLINGAVKEDWTTDNTHSYTLTADDVGKNSITVRVKDPLTTVECSPPVEIYVFRASPAVPE